MKNTSDEHRTNHGEIWRRHFQNMIISLTQQAVSFCLIHGSRNLWRNVGLCVSTTRTGRIISLLCRFGISKEKRYICMLKRMKKI